MHNIISKIITIFKHFNFKYVKLLKENIYKKRFIGYLFNKVKGYVISTVNNQQNKCYYDGQFAVPN